MAPWNWAGNGIFHCGISLILMLASLSNLGSALHSTDTITSAGDNSRSGYQDNHNIDPSVVGSPEFGVLWRKKLLGKYRGWTEQIFAQALVYTPENTQYVYIASQMNMVYKLDAKTGDILASRNLHIPFLVSELDNCNDISFCIGSTATGVIDPETNTWYLTTKTYRDQTEVEKGRANGRYYVHALDVNTLEERPNFPVNLEGLIASNNPIRTFQAGIHHQRPALVQIGPYIYAGFASHCVQYNFTGWVIGWHRTTGEIVEKFATEGGPEDEKGGGIWMSGGGIASDGIGRMFFATGNGYASQLHNIPLAGRQPPTSLEEAAVHMAIAEDGKLSVVDFFIPWEKEALDGADKDLGTSGIALLDPAVFKTDKVRRMGCIAGKSGKLYFLNLDDLGGYQMGPNKKDAVLQTHELKNSVFATAGVYPLEGGYVYVNVVQHPTVVFKYAVENGAPVFNQVAETDETTAYILGVGHGTTTSLNGQPGTGLYWVVDIQGLQLRAYKAVPENGRLVRVLGLNIPGQMKFSRPTFGNGRLYLTTSAGDVVAVGSPVNLPLACDSPIEFGTVVVGGGGNSTTATKEISCKANINVQVTGISPRGGQSWSVSDLPTLPLTVAKGSNVTFKAKFTPTAHGPVSDDIYVNTTNGVAGYSVNTPVVVRGIGRSLVPVLSIQPNSISFPSIITGTDGDTEGKNQTMILVNAGSSALTISGYSASSSSDKGPFVPLTDGNKFSVFTFHDLPTTIAGESSVPVVINANPPTNGAYAAHLQVLSDGGTKVETISAEAGQHAHALIEFESPYNATNGSTIWIPYGGKNSTFSFGNVLQQTTRYLNLRITNVASNTSEVLGLTVSKPPVGAGKMVGASNQIDLGEGTQLHGGESASAQLFCSVPKSQPNTDAYTANTTWTMNTNDPLMTKQDIAFTCTAVAPQLGPLLPNGTARYRYIGCYKENNPARQLSTQLFSRDTTEAGVCTSACAGGTKAWIFAGLQYHRECWCGDTLPALRVPDANCNFDCTGAGDQMCGGNGVAGGGAFLSLYADALRFDGNVTIPVSTTTVAGTPPTPTPTPGAPVSNPGNGNWTLVGCYKEPTTGRALTKLTGDDALTVAKCWEYCDALGLGWAGAEYARECWCGAALSAGANKTLIGECGMKCKGNASEFCGAGGRLSLYQRGAAVLM
ncbi:hypothetical protein EDC01DRAFT_621661 [Geopyxis carbonaria]|nr:hypothetical protein EDC01DRAFT_621661 [Geopyxis carbonaria]